MNERIFVDPNLHFGKPCGIGTRITVQSVLELVKEGIPFVEIVEDIQACVQYAIDVIAAEDIHITTATA